MCVDAKDVPTTTANMGKNRTHSGQVGDNAMLYRVPTSYEHTKVGIIV